MTTETGGEDDIVIIEGTEPEADPAKQPDDAGAAVVEEADESDDDDDDGDSRLATSEDDNDAEIVSQNKKRRQERRERQKRAREQSEAELRFLREQVAALNQRVATTENHALTSVEQQMVQRYHAKVQEAKQAEDIMARAINAGNGEDSVAASRIRDAAIAEARQLQEDYKQLQTQKQAAATPAANPAAKTYASEWTAANPWFDPTGSDEDSAIAIALDTQMMKEGHDPTTRGYWETLSRRLSARLNPGEAAVPAADPEPRRKAPPVGMKHEHVPASTKTEIYISPEQKAAMMEAGYWDDPVKRARMAKVYAEANRQAARTGAGS